MRGAATARALRRFPRGATSAASGREHAMQRRDLIARTGAALAASLASPALRPARAAAPIPPGYRVTWFEAATPGSGRVGSRDVTSAGDGTFWFCGQRNGTLNRLDPRDDHIRSLHLGQGAAPHNVIRGPDGAAWVTEGGQNAIARVDAGDHKLRLWRLPERFANANLNTGIFDPQGRYWFTGQGGIYGRFDPRSERMEVWEAPRGPGPYGITRTPQGTVWFVSLAGSYLAQIDDLESGRVRVIEPPTQHQGARRVWSDSAGRLWISEWNSGNVSVHDPRDGS